MPPTWTLLTAFESLWEGIYIDPWSQNLAAPVRHVCQYGLSNATVEISQFLLSRTHPAVDGVEIFDIQAAQGAPRESASLFAQLEAEFGNRVTNNAELGKPPLPMPEGATRFPDHAAGQAPPRTAPCDAVVFSEAAPYFTVERVLRHLRDDVLFALVSHSCIVDADAISTPRCNYFNMIWEKTALWRRGYCKGPVCMARVPAGTLRDPQVLPLECEAFRGAGGSGASIAEFGQDWFLYWNFLRHGRGAGAGAGPPVYVDVGASLPFEYSNSVVFDRCLGWRGVCVEPNPFLAPFLRSHRTCDVVTKCVDTERVKGKSFTDRSGEFVFAADCAPLGEMLESAGLRGRRIDVLSIDVEHGELRALQGLPLDEYDIRLIVIEVTQGARWLEVDTELLPRGYIKVAVLGRDVVYVKMDDLSTQAFAEWPFLGNSSLALPADWAEFHQRVVDDEVEQEMRRERRLMKAGKRRLWQE